MFRALRTILFLLTAVLTSACSVFGIRTEEQPHYSVLRTMKPFEIRQYDPYVVAATSAEGPFEKTQNGSFRILARYIFGGNESKQSISMTAPVVQNPKMETWTMTFSLPKKYSLSTAPKPNDPRVQLREIPAETIAVLRFSGTVNEKKVRLQEEVLKNWILEQGDLEITDEPRLAGYDPPFTIPFLRRNEIMIPIKIKNN